MRAGAVTAHCTSNLPDPTAAYGRDDTVPYASADPSESTPAPAAEHRSQKWDVTVHVLIILLLVGTTVVGMAMLRGPRGVPQRAGSRREAVTVEIFRTYSRPRHLPILARTLGSQPSRWGP